MKLKTVLFALALMLLTLSATAQENLKPVEYRLETIEDHARVKDFKYYSYEKLCAEATAQAQNELLSAQQTERLLESIPKGGGIVTHLLGSTWDMANGTNWTYVVMDNNGNEVFRSKGHDQRAPAPVVERRGVVYRGFFGRESYSREELVAPEKTVFGDPVFSARDEISIPLPLPDSFKIYVIDGINRNRCSYLVTKEKP